MRHNDLLPRTKAFALQIIRLTELLPRTRTADVLGKQLLRCGTSVGANYRAACRARSKAEFTAKMAIVLEEADESIYWLDLMKETRIIDGTSAASLISEANELVSIAVASIKTAKGL